MITLGIESTCDETAFALMKGQEVLSHVIASSAELHQEFGGVFPELASRCHFENMLPLLKKVLVVDPKEIDLIAVADGPGLIGSLLMGLQTAKGLSIAWKKPLIGVNHVEAHLFASMMDLSKPWPLPALGLVISGGHTFLVQIDKEGEYHLIGTTVDDALGEAFDKVGSMIDLPYPAGPLVEKLAKTGNPTRYAFKAGTVKEKPLHFSFSGLKTSVLYTLQKEPEASFADVAASFQEAAFQDLVKKSKKALELFEANALFFGGGVSCNQALRKKFEQNFADFPLYFPDPALSLDNAIMIAALGAEKYQTFSKVDSLDLKAKPRYSFSEWMKVIE